MFHRVQVPNNIQLIPINASGLKFPACKKNFICCEITAECGKNGKMMEGDV